MTLRARPVARRRGRAGWDAGDRRNTLINLGFFIAIGVSVLILVGYAAWSWYDDHFGAAATVNGQVITKDDLRARLKIDSFNLNYLESRITTLMVKGRISAADGQAQIDSLNQRRQQLAGLTLENLVDITLMTKLARDNGVEVSEADIDAQLVRVATTPAQRHVWMIEIEPEADPVTGEITEEQRQAALGRAQSALTRLKNGESWDDVAKTASDSAFAPQAGDLGWLPQDSGYDKAFMDAVFAVAQDSPTEVIEGEDDTFRIGRFTESAAEEVDGAFESAVTTDGITVAEYRAAARGDVTRRKLSEKIVADLSKPGIQRHVLEIYLPEPNASSTGIVDGVKVRHIVFSPNDDPGKAEDVPATDPAWAKAKADADAAYAQIKADPTKFDALARTLSDERSSKGTGGKQPWYYPGSTIDQDFKNAILAEGLTPGQLLEPIKSGFGWHVIQFMRPTGDGDKAWLESLKAKATDDASFKQLAIDNSEAPDAKDGGDMGWIAKGQLTEQLDAKVFSTAIGATSDVVDIEGDGVYLLRVLGEETRTPTEEQLKIFEESGFDYWYTAQKDAADIDYNLADTSGAA